MASPGISVSGYAQNSGSFLLIPDSYFAQMLNPSVSRNDNKIILAFPGLAGFSFSNTGNFRITDLVYPQANGELAYDFNRFYDKLDDYNYSNQAISLPLFYIGIPKSWGMFSIYLKENAHLYTHFPKNAFLWFENGNQEDQFRNFQSGNINALALGYHELAFGFTNRSNPEITTGIRGKFIFGGAAFDFRDLNYGLNTSYEGDLVQFRSSGSGTFSLPGKMVGQTNNRLENIDGRKLFKNYFLVVHNPGFAVDLAVTAKIDDWSKFSVGISDLGFIWLKNDSWTISQNEIYNFEGINISNSIDSKKNQEYINPQDLIKNTKDSLGQVFKPFLDARSTMFALFPSIYFNYQHDYSKTTSFTISNQTKLYKRYIVNTFSVNTKTNVNNFSLLANCNLHNIQSFSFGGGVYWEKSFLQAFLMVDNLMAIYHPANSKSYTVSAGMSFLIESKKVEINRIGKTSKYFPFFKKYE